MSSWSSPKTSLPPKHAEDVRKNKISFSTAEAAPICQFLPRCTPENCERARSRVRFDDSQPAPFSSSYRRRSLAQKTERKPEQTLPLLYLLVGVNTGRMISTRGRRWWSAAAGGAQWRRSWGTALKRQCVRWVSAPWSVRINPANTIACLCHEIEGYSAVCTSVCPSVGDLARLIELPRPTHPLPKPSRRPTNLPIIRVPLVTKSYSYLYESLEPRISS